jgi:hypothetical protein
VLRCAALPLWRCAECINKFRLLWGADVCGLCSEDGSFLETDFSGDGCIHFLILDDALRLPVRDSPNAVSLTILPPRVGFLAHFLVKVDDWWREGRKLSERLISWPIDKHGTRT